MTGRYDHDVLAGGPPRIARVPLVAADPGLVVEDAATGWCGAVVEAGKDLVLLEDRFGKRRAFPMDPAAFRFEGALCTLVKPKATARAGAKRTASGSVAVPYAPARVARASRILVEGLHDAALIERVWGDDLRDRGRRGGGPARRRHPSGSHPRVRAGPEPALGVLVDHLVPGSKEALIAAAVSCRIRAGHRASVRGRLAGGEAQGGRHRRMAADPEGHRLEDRRLLAAGMADPATGWRTVLAAVNSYADLEVPLLTAVEHLIDFVTAAAVPQEASPATGS